MAIRSDCTDKFRCRVDRSVIRPVPTLSLGQHLSNRIIWLTRFVNDATWFFFPRGVVSESLELGERQDSCSRKAWVIRQKIKCNSKRITAKQGLIKMQLFGRRSVAQNFKWQ